MIRLQSRNSYQLNIIKGVKEIELNTKYVFMYAHWEVI